MHIISILLTLTYGAAQTITLNQGEVYGFDYVTKNQDIAEIFLNIPYAAPPVGELRFEKPAPPVPWETIRNGTAFGPTCHPHTRQAAIPPKPDEDCLTLNIIRPKKTAPAAGYPILVWVHGGGYEIGSASLYGFKGFADIYIPNDIIVVPIQYRVGVYGFFSSGDSRIPGNLGLYDMAAAFKFIHENAHNFGGDPSRVTAWGLSAGGGAVGQLALSPLSRDYIAGVIEMSGTPWAYWTLGSTVANNSLELAEELNCAGDDIKSCLKAKSVDEIYDAVIEVVPVVFNRNYSLDCIKWGPVIDGEFLHHPDDMLATASAKPLITGVSDKDASFFTIKALSPFIHKFGVKREDFESYDRKKLVDFFKKIIHNDYYKNYTDDAIREIVDFYVSRDEEDSYEFYLDRYTQFMSDLLFNAAAVDAILARRQAGWKVYAYSFDHYNDAIWDPSVPTRLRGSPHVNEYPYMFDIFALGKYEIDEKEEVVADIIQQSFISFVKNGVPSNQHTEWSDVGKEKDIEYLSISPKPQMKKNFYQEAANFWAKLRKKHGFDLIQLLPTRPEVDTLKDEL